MIEKSDDTKTGCQSMVNEYNVGYQAGYKKAEQELGKKNCSDDTDYNLYTSQLIKSIESQTWKSRSGSEVNYEYSNFDGFLKSFQLKLNSAEAAYQLIDFFTFNNSVEKRFFYLVAGLYTEWLNVLDKSYLSEFLNDSKRLKYINGEKGDLNGNSVHNYFNIISILEKTLILRGLLVLKDIPYNLFIFNQFHSAIIQYMDKYDGFRSIPENSINPNRPFQFKQQNVGCLNQIYWHCFTYDIIQYFKQPHLKVYDDFIEIGKKSFETYKVYQKHHHTIHRHISQKINDPKNTTETILDKLYPFLFKLYTYPCNKSYIDQYYKSLSDAETLCEKSIQDIKNGHIGSDTIENLTLFYYSLKHFTENTLVCK